MGGFWDELISEYHFLGYEGHMGAQIKYVITLGDQMDFESRNIVQYAGDSIGAQWILNGMAMPKYKTIQRTIDAFLEELDDVFTQILEHCEQQSLIGGERAYTDGVKVQANASKHKAMSYKYLGKENSPWKRRSKDAVCCDKGYGSFPHPSLYLSL